MNGDLARFQQDFLHALYHPDDAPPGIAALAAQPGFAVYRNTVIKGCVDALQANFPAVARLTGQDWFRAAAARYARRAPPTAVALLDYGEDFADFLAAFEPARGLPYLPGVARLDRLWIAAHGAAAGEPLRADTLAGMPPDALGALSLPPHPAARWAWHADMPVYAIWHANRGGTAVAEDLPWRGDGALLTRPAGAVQWRAVGPGACAFLDACAVGLSLAEAARAAAQAEPDIDLAGLLSDLILAGALGAPRRASPAPAHPHP